MAGPSPTPRRADVRARWPRHLHRGALLLGASSALYWSSFGLGPQSLWIPGFGILHADLLLAWSAVLLHVAAWPSLWVGLRDLRVRRPADPNPVLARRAFLLALALVLAALVALPLQYHAFASTEAWLLALYATAFPFVAWAFVPILALHGILFGRVANYLDGPSRRLADLGALILFGVAAASVLVILQHPGALAFVRSWSVGRGLMPAVAFGGYALIAVGMTLHIVPGRARPRKVGVARGP